MDDATVEILLRVKEQGQEAFERASIGLGRVREALQRFRDAEARGLATDAAMRAAMGSLMEQAIKEGIAFDKLGNEVTDVRQALTHYHEAVVAGIPVDEAQRAVINDVAARYREEAVAATEATAAQEATTLAAGGGIPVWIGWAAAIVGVTGVLSPFIILAGSAVVILTAFAVAGAGMIALLGAIGIAIGGLGAGALALGVAGMGGTGAAANLAKATANLKSAQAAVSGAPGPTAGTVSQAAQNRIDNARRSLAQWEALHTGYKTLAQQFTETNLKIHLAQAEQAGQPKGASAGGPTAGQIQRLHDAQLAYNKALAATRTPISVFLGHLDKMKDSLEKQAVPIATLILQWADKAVPAIQKLGSTILAWFGQRVPGILSGIGKVFHDLGPDFERFGRFISQAFDANEGKIGPMAEQFVRLGLAITQNLLTALGSLTTWFEDRLPTYGPIINQIMGGIGSAIAGVAQVWGNLADWLVQNWPTIVKNAKLATQSIAQAWHDWEPDLKAFTDQILPLIPPLLEDIARNSGTLVPVVMGLAEVFLSVATAVLAVVSGIEHLLGLFESAQHKIQDFDSAVGGFVGGLVGGGGSSSGTHSQGARTNAPNVTINVNGSSNPTATAAAVNKRLRGLISP